MFSKDEKACQKEVEEYAKAIDKYGLDNIEDGWGQNKKRYMIDAFRCGFFAGRDYIEGGAEKVFMRTFEKAFEDVQVAYNKFFYNLKNMKD